VKLAPGATGTAVLRHTLIETLALSGLGGLLGLVLAAIALRAGVSFLPETLPRISSIGLDWQVVGFALLAAIVAGLLCGLVPALAAVRTNVNETLKEGGRTGTPAGGHARLRSTLVVAEMAGALVLLIASGLRLRSFEKLRSVDLGLRADHMLTAAYALPQRQYATPAAIDLFNDTLLRKLGQLPGRKAVGITSKLPASGNFSNSAFTVDGDVAAHGSKLNLSWPSQVMGDYFQAAGIALVRGREFTSADNHRKSPLVVIVNRSFAEPFGPGQNPIGKRLRSGMQETPTGWMTVVGEIGDVKQHRPDVATQYPIDPPADQNTASDGQRAPADSRDGQGGLVALRTVLPPDQMMNALRATVPAIDPQIPLTHGLSMESAVSETEAPRRFNAALISSFAAAAVLLAWLGIDSVIAFSAAMRTQEIAIRLAPGSQRIAVLGPILVSGARLGLIGWVLGAVGAASATKWLRSMLFEVDSLDPAVIILAAVSIFLLALAASLVPARRAAAIEPIAALRTE
jgi:predicted permease